MKIELESEDVERIAQRVVELLRPVVSVNGNQKDEDVIFDVKGLSEYLKVNNNKKNYSWVYKQVSSKSIPYFKVGKYTRFRKKDIDKWIESHEIPSLIRFKPLKKAV